MKYLFGNWKLYLGHTESVTLAQGIAKLSVPSEVQVAVFPPAVSIPSVAWALQGTSVALGAQHCDWAPQGAYTGAVSAAILKEVGCRYALIGHSERRHIFGETDAMVRKELEVCLEAGITPVLCIGETKEDKENEKREYRLKKQLFTALSEVNLNGGKIMIAYEPVWAIGSGEPCLPADVDDVHGWIQLEVKQYGLTDIPVLYGGSVTPLNVVSYGTLPTVAGVLVGSASTNVEGLSALATGLHSVSSV